MMRIIPLTGAEDRRRLLGEAEAIFWESAGTRQFADAEARAAYRALWFARYSEYAPEAFFIALGTDGGVSGYLAGSPVSDAPPLPGPDYYALFPAVLMARYPAHLHVNVRADRRGSGIGAALVGAFCGYLQAEGIGGVHAVTAAHSRAAAFFERCGLAWQAQATWRGRELVFLAGRGPA